MRQKNVLPVVAAIAASLAAWGTVVITRTPLRYTS
jgi:hypothetical protein